jgi:antibiotic biosynthesis monooxygenase (ABM) superfamily enzyme
VLKPALLQLAIVPQVMVTAALQVSLLTCLSLPILTRVLRRWFYGA